MPSSAASTSADPLRTSGNIVIITINTITMNLNAGNRLVWVDSLKGWLMILVILGHSIQSVMPEGCYNNHVWNLIYSFHMPAFMALSGWLTFRGANNVDCKKFLQTTLRRARQLLVPFLLWSLLSAIFFKKASISAFLNMIVYPDTSFWFLWVLFWISFIFKGTQLLSRLFKINENILIIFACLLLIGLMVLTDTRVFGFQFISYYFLFFSVGYFVHKWNLADMKSFIVMLLVVLWAILGWFWSMHSLPSWFPHVKHIPASLLQYAYRGLTAIIAVVAILCSSHAMFNKSGKFNLWMAKLGNVSLGLYTVHLLLISTIAKLIMRILPGASDIAYVAIVFAVAFASAYLIVILLSKNKFTGRLLLGKI